MVVEVEQLIDEVELARRDGNPPVTVRQFHHVGALRLCVRLQPSLQAAVVEWTVQQGGRGMQLHGDAIHGHLNVIVRLMPDGPMTFSQGSCQCPQRSPPYGGGLGGAPYINVAQHPAIRIVVHQCVALSFEYAALRAQFLDAPIDRCRGRIEFAALQLCHLRLCYPFQQPPSFGCQFLGKSLDALEEHANQGLLLRKLQ